eukprot:8792374-Lingulodinium_polyedra.AAC.1
MARPTAPLAPAVGQPVPSPPRGPAAPGGPAPAGSGRPHQHGMKYVWMPRTMCIGRSPPQPGSSSVGARHSKSR